MSSGSAISSIPGDHLLTRASGGSGLNHTPRRKRRNTEIPSVIPANVLNIRLTDVSLKNCAL